MSDDGTEAKGGSARLSECTDNPWCGYVIRVLWVCYYGFGFTLAVRLASVMNPVWATIRCWGLTLRSLVCQKRKRLSMVWM